MDGLMDELYDPVESSALEPDDDKQMVSRAVLRQAMWERDIALKQLSEIGKGLGEKMDDVAPVVHGYWIIHLSYWLSVIVLERDDLIYGCMHQQRKQQTWRDKKCLTPIWANLHQVWL